jgi:hypothetical protein
LAGILEENEMTRQVSLSAAMLLLPGLLCLTSINPASAQGKKPTVKPPTKPATQTGVKSATQMAGDNGQLGQNYMVGAKGEELVFTLTSAEYTVARTMVGGDPSEMAVPKGDEKVLLLRFSVQNPQKVDLDYNGGSFVITAVDAKDVNHVVSFVGRQGTSEQVNLQLKPAQKLDIFTAVTVPAAGQVPKLIIQRGDGNPVLRYDLRGKVKQLVAPFVDPADATGATARPEVTAKLATFYPLMLFDVRMDATAFTPGPLEGQEAEEGKRFLTATVTLKNLHVVAIEYAGGTFQANLTLASGEKVESNGMLLRPNRDEATNGTLKPGETVTVRLYFLIPTSDAPKTLRLQETDQSRTYAFDISGTK